MIRRTLRRWLGIDALESQSLPALPPEPKLGEPRRNPMKGINPEAMALAAVTESGRATPGETWKPYRPMTGVIPQGHRNMAMDQDLSNVYQYALAAAFHEGITFLGYPYLAELSQRAEYRRPVEIIAKAMTRKWIKLKARGEEDKTELIEHIENCFKKLEVQDRFRQIAEQDGYFGRGQLYIDLGTTSDREELRVPCIPDPVKVPMHSFERLTVVEPMWSYPNNYNSNDPLQPDFFRPTSWFVMGKEVHSTRLLTFVSRPLPDILKPVYAFGGLSLSQLVKPYVDNWLRTRQSVSDLISAFSTMVLKTNMSEVLNGGAGQMLFHRAKFFNHTRNNRSLMIVDKEMEDLINIAVPLGTLDALQAQSQEHMASVSGIPLIILFAITPTGLNASSDAELKVFEQWINSQQETLFTPPLNTILKYVQVSEFGSVDPDVTFEYVPLTVQDLKEIIEERHIEAQTDVELINAGVISPEESRSRLAADDDSPYAGLDLTQMPISPAEQQAQHEEEMAQQMGAMPNGPEDETTQPGEEAETPISPLAPQPGSPPPFSKGNGGASPFQKKSPFGG